MLFAAAKVHGDRITDYIITYVHNDTDVVVDQLYFTPFPMSAVSGIGVSADLATRFSDAVADDSVRFLKVSIRDGLTLFLLNL